MASTERQDPTLLLPEEPMVYELKKKKKKKKKHREQVDPLREIDDGIKKFPETTIFDDLDCEVNIKVENIEVELDFNDFADSAAVSANDPARTQDPPVNLPDSTHSRGAVILTFENVINEHTHEFPSLFQDGFLDVFQNGDDAPPEAEPEPEEVHTCAICHMIFKSQRTLHLHQRKKHKTQRRSFKYKCRDCGLTYEKKNSLVTHQKRKHGPDSVPDDTEPRTCEICALVFKGMMRLRMHMQRKHNAFTDSFKFQCVDCGLTYDKYRSLVVHNKRKHSNTKSYSTQWLNCPLCAKVCMSRDAYVRHLQRIHHKDESEKFPPGFLEDIKPIASGELQCTECSLVFSSHMYLKLHMRRKHNAYKEDFRLKCLICSLSYDNSESLKRHVKRVHTQSVFCDVCGKQFKSKEAFSRHTHDKKSIHECSVCGLIFASSGGLRKHLRCTHKIDYDLKTVFCHVCKQGFNEARNLKAHIMRVHMNVKYPCKFCAKTFKTNQSFRRHVIRFHNYPQTSKQHACTDCPLAFENENELCKHMFETHPKTDIKVEDIKMERVDVKVETTDVKHELDDQYQCTKCSHSAQTFEELRKHYELNHHTIQKVQCQACGDFVVESELGKHMKNSHPVMLECSYCEFKTHFKLSLTQHVLRHKNAVAFTCDHEGCKYKSYFKEAIEKHKKKHLNQGVRLQCTKCPFKTMNKYILRYHEELHATGVKKYKCDKCEYSTILPANLVTHKYKHSAEKRFKCEYCTFATKYNTSLRFHVKKKHCDLPFLGATQ